ncbi:interferon-induced very large GTPase 1-like [Lineus longissimus]|uniref:interferon-induced very large GTPase 1-like n=1 Tax=Lineus longissimus TaxID=88925 RepID=UPI00315DA481
MATKGKEQPAEPNQQHTKRDKALVFELMNGITDQSFMKIKFYLTNNPIAERDLQDMNSPSDFMSLWQLLLQKRVIRPGNYELIKECFEMIKEENLLRIVEKYEESFTPDCPTYVKRSISPPKMVSRDRRTSPTVPAAGPAKAMEQADAKISVEVEEGDNTGKGVGLNQIPGHSEKERPGKTIEGNTSDRRSLHFNEKQSELLKQLGLSEYFPNKLSLQNLMCKPIPREENGYCIKELAWVMLRRLVMINYNGRDCELPMQGSSEQGNESFEDSSDDFSRFLDTLDYGSPKCDSVQENLHPMDVFLTLFSCCDLLLRQTLVQKMYMCRLAIPFLIQDAVSGIFQICLWSMRTIVTEWRESPKSVKEASIVNYPLDIVSFIKMKEPSILKSKLMNDVISDQSHPTFFHGDCIGGRRKRQLATGMVEAAWSLPSEKSDSFAQKPTMFLNLRGNSIEKRKQLRMLATISSAVVVLIEFADLLDDDALKTLKSIHGTNNQVMLVVTCTQANIPERTKMQKTFLEYNTETNSQLKPRNVVLCFHKGNPRSCSEITRDIRSRITQILMTAGQRTLEGVCSLVKKQGISIDEDDTDCQRGKALAEKITYLMKDRSLKDCKEEMLPLQGKLWLKWSEHQRKQLRSGTKTNPSTFNEKLRLQDEKAKYRMKQLERFKYRHELMQQFTESLHDNIDNLKTVSFLLQWLRLYFDSRSRETLPALRQQYLECWTRFRVVKGKDDRAADLDQLKQDIDVAGQNLLDASFGLEHLLREAGQIYEAAFETAEKQSQDVRNRLPNYPVMAAKLLLQGQPIEIMDGNASVVPLCWIKAIFRSLREVAGNKKIFVISVLGVQSSGKSTLLNTMFGLQFPVSAGRCTRGLYMQLFSVDRNLPYDYIMVIDTEGLRAPELGTDDYNHDNELATLVIGLGDVTILNIKGENIAEMKDVLQIAVHAFLRMKIVNRNIKLQQSCIFTHQNVAGVAANEQMIQGRHQLLESLDEMAKQAAIQENITDVMTFKKVIDFHEEKHVWYFSDLWQGDPPMAPTNPGYSKRVQEVRDCIMNDIALKKERFLTFDDMETHIEDLWNGILSEDFVFTFRSSLSIKAYVKLEGFFREMSWQLKNHLTAWLQETAEKRLDECENEENLREKCIVMVADMESICHEKVEECEKQLNNYFEEDNLRYISIQWKEEKKSSLHSTAQICLIEGQEEIKRLGDNRRADLGSNRKDIEHLIQEKANDLSSSLKGRSMTDSEIREDFDKMWQGVMTNLNLKKPRDCMMKIAGDVEQVLRERFSTDGIHLRPELAAQPIHETVNAYTSLLDSMVDIQLTKDHLSVVQSPTFDLGGYEEDPDEISKQLSFAWTTTDTIMRKTELSLSEICSKDNKFQRRFVEQIVKLVADGIESHNRDAAGTSGHFMFLPHFKVKLTVHVCRYATQQFVHMQRTYENEHGLLGKLDNFEKRLWHEFESTVRNREAEIIAADLMGALLNDAISRMIRIDLPLKMISHTRQYFNDDKFFLMTKVLEDLAEKDNFGYYSSFIRDSASYAELWFKRFMEKMYFPKDDERAYGGPDVVAEVEQLETSGKMGCGKEHTHEYLKLRELWVRNIFLIFENAFDATLTYIQIEDNPTIEQWIGKLRSFQLGLSEQGLFDIIKYRVTDFKNLHVELQKRIENIRKKIRENIRLTKARSYKWEGPETPFKMVFDKLWGCKKQCPFCNAPCRWLSDHKQRHQCIQHRPEGISGQKLLQTRELLTETCNYNVQSTRSFRCMCRPCRPCRQQGPEPGVEVWHKYRDYIDYYPDWEIAPNPVPDSNEYWMWFMARYLEKLTGFHGAEDMPKLDERWYKITKVQAIQSLHKYKH